MPIETMITAARSEEDGYINAKPAPRAAEAIADNDDDEEIGDWIYQLSRTAKNRAAAAKKAAAATTAERGRASFQDQPPKSSQQEDRSKLNERGVDQSKKTMLVKRSLTGRSGRFVTKEAIALSCGKSRARRAPTKDAPTMPKLEESVLGMARNESHVATKDAATMPKLEVSAGVMGQIKPDAHATMKDARSLPRVEESAVATGQNKPAAYAAMKDAAALPKREEYAGGTGRRATHTDAVMKDAPAFPQKGVSAASMGKDQMYETLNEAQKGRVTQGVQMWRG